MGSFLLLIIFFMELLIVANAFFITGTDTEIGKTFVTTALIHAATYLDFKVAGYKPIASDAVFNIKTQRYENRDALSLINSSNIPLNYHEVNPYCFAQATSPHIASRLNQQKIDTTEIDNNLINLNKKADIIFIEGAGGWFTPITEQLLFSDWVKRQQLPIILVVGMKLGCINHALLTQQAIEQANLTLCGWIANCCIAQGEFYAQYLCTLKRLIHAPLIAEIPYLPDANIKQLTPYFNLSFLTGTNR